MGPASKNLSNKNGRKVSAGNVFSLFTLKEEQLQNYLPTAVNLILLLEEERNVIEGVKI